MCPSNHVPDPVHPPTGCKQRGGCEGCVRPTMCPTVCPTLCIHPLAVNSDDAVVNTALLIAHCYFKAYSAMPTQAACAVPTHLVWCAHPSAAARTHSCFRTRTVPGRTLVLQSSDSRPPTFTRDTHKCTHQHPRVRKRTRQHPDVHKHTRHPNVCKRMRPPGVHKNTRRRPDVHKH